MKNQAPQRSHSEFIQSASVTALMRALLSNEKGMLKNPDYMAQSFVSEPWSDFLGDIKSAIGALSKRVPGCMNYHLVRTKQFDETLLNWVSERDNGQVIILGAGLDSRALRFSKELEKFQVYELDLESMFSYKQKIIAEKLEMTPKSSFIPINFGLEKLTDILFANCVDKNSDTFILWEGVTYFLDEVTVTELLTEIYDYFTNSCFLIFDYAYLSYINGDHSYYGAVEIYNELQEINEPHVFGIEPNSLLAYAEKHKWSLAHNYTANELESKFLNDLHKIHGFHGIAVFSK